MKQPVLGKKQLINIALLFFLLSSTSLSAQEPTDSGKKAPEKPWKITNASSITFSQVSLSNWAAGGENSVSGNGTYAINANYKKGNNSWETAFEIAYGETRQGDAKSIKNDDRIQFATKYGRKASEKWNYTVLGSFKSQMLPGEDNPTDRNVVSDWMAPGYFGLSIGMDYKPTQKISVFISPLAAKLTIVNRQDLADLGSFGVKKAEYDGLGNKVKDGENMLQEAGAFIKAQGIFPIYKEKITLTSKFELYSNYITDPQNIDVLAENTLDAKINSWLTAKLFVLAFYDDNSKTGKDTNGDGKMDKYTAKIQVKEIFGLGIGVKW